MSRQSLALTLRSIPTAAYALAGVLAVLSAVSWLLVAQANMPMMGVFDWSALFWFTVIWGVGMVAMMFPSIIPMAYMIRMATSKSPNVQAGNRVAHFLAPAVFVLGYVSIWTLVGVPFYLAITGLANMGQFFTVGSLGVFAGAVLVATGLYQFTRFKQNALMKCRSPMGFVVTSWRDGVRGAALMGADYGTFCTKCCWVLMAGLLFVGAMSLPLMGVFAIIIFAEKIGPFGSLISKIVGIAFVATGVFLAVPL